MNYKRDIDEDGGCGDNVDEDNELINDGVPMIEDDVEDNEE